jgi:3',5'-cyclic AMP phosphodiesterase CpdA
MRASDDTPVRLAHLSDVHVSVRSAWRPRDWFSKRLSSWVNLRLLGRGKSFALAERVLTALREELCQRGCDRVLFSGDATALGFEEEVARAAQLLGVGQPDALPGLAVPGNHDYLTPSAASGGHFERHFAPWLVGERVGEEVYPFAQRVGHAWVVAVNSSKPNRWPTDASGRVGAAQLHRLEALLARLEGGPRILLTHYPVSVASGQREKRSRGLHDLDDLLAVAKAGGIGLWLHGHRHHAFHHDTAAVAPFPVICAGSATQRGLWSYGEYTLRGHRLATVQRVYDVESGGFRDGRAFEVELP